MQYAGFVVNYLDIAPTFAGTILGIGNTISCIAGMIGPLMVGQLTPTVIFGVFYDFLYSVMYLHIHIT